MEDKHAFKTIKLLDDHGFQIPIKGAPFKAIHLVSDKNVDGVEYTKIPDLMELVGNAIAFKSGKLDEENRGSWDNVIDNLDDMDYVKGYRPRYMGVGYSEMKYDKRRVREYLIKRHSAYLSSLICQSNQPVWDDLTLDTKVQKWKIKEDQADQLLEQIHDGNFKKIFSLGENDGWDHENTRRNLESSRKSI